MKYYILQLLILLTSLNLTAQFQKEWELHTPSDISSVQAFDLLKGKNLKTYKIEEEEFITVSISNKQTGYGFYIKVIRYNSNGELIWEYLYNNNSVYGEWMTDSHIDSENNVLISAATIVGDTILMNGETVAILTDYNLLKLSPDGFLIWQLKEEFPTSCEGIISDDENNIYTIGHKVDLNGMIESRLFKYDKLGNKIFDQYIDHRSAFDIKLVEDEIYIITKGSGQNSNKMYRYSIEGDLIFESTIEWLSRKKPSIDKEGNIFIMFGVGSFNLAKYNKEGLQEWIYEKPTNLPDNVHSDESISNHIDDDGFIYLTGRFYGENYGTPSYTNADILTTKIDNQGNVIWEDIYNYDGTGSGQIAYKVKVDDNGNVYSVGHQTREKDGDIYGSDDMILLKYNDQGIRIDSIIYNGDANNEDFGVNLMLDNENIYLIGISQDENAKFRNSIIKYSLLSNTQENELNKNVTIFPNPFIDIINLNIDGFKDFKIEIIDLNGRTISKTNQSKIDLSLCPSGIYFAKITSTNHRAALIIKLIKI